MALSVSSTRAARSHAGARTQSPRVHAPRTRVVTVRAGLGDAFNYVGQAFMKIFSPPQDKVESWSGTTSPFAGKINHSAKRPFADNYVAGGQKYSTHEQINYEQQPEKAAQTGGDASVMDYMGGALERVVGHNFTGDETEPTTTTGSVGWKGDIHDRKTEGFHTRRV